MLHDRQRVVEALRARDGDACGICCRPLASDVEVDHIRPRAAGGHASDLDNLQLTHRACNRRKHASYDPTTLFAIGVDGGEPRSDKLISVRVDDTTHDRAVAAAKAENRSLSGMVRHLIAERVAKLEERNAA